VRVLVGDQADREFWSRFRVEVPTVDIVVDDGSHQVDGQSVAFEELFPHLRPAGIYVVEDVHGVYNSFATYAGGLVRALNFAQMTKHSGDREREVVSATSAFQQAVEAIHSYPFITFFERRASPVEEFVAPRRGTQWQPFLG